MKRTATYLMLIGTIVLVTPLDVWARGGGRGGGGGGARGGGGGGMRGGGVSRLSPSVGRSPSMGGSRPTPRPSPSPRPSPGTGASRPGTGARPGGAAPRPGGAGAGVSRPGGAGVATRPSPGARPGTGGRPSAGQLNNFLDIPNSPRGPSVSGGTRPAGGGAAADFLQRGQASQLPAGGARPAIANRPAAGGPGVAARPGAPGVARPGLAAAGVAGAAGAAAAGNRMANNRPQRIENRQEWQGNRQERRDQVRDQVQENHPRLDFWSDHPNWAAWRINAPYRWATWAAVSSWVGGYGWSEPTSYSYGEDVYYSDGQVYSGDQPVASAEEYADQAATIAESAPEAPPADSEWLPLGVFALTQDGQPSGADPTLFMQLAISKEGIISGTFKNMASGQVQTLEGMADKASQRAAWCVKDTQYPIVETGISNLTQDTAPILIHFADGQTQQWLMVRLDEPKQQ